MKTFTFKRIIGLVIITAINLSFIWGQTKVYVKTDGVNFNAIANHVTWETATHDLQAAIDALGDLENGGEVWVKSGIYYPTVDIPSAPENNTNTKYQSFMLRNNVRVIGGFAGSEATIDARVDYDFGEANATILSGELQQDGEPANNSFHVVFAAGGTDETAILEGFVITQGYAENGLDPNGRGGGIHTRTGGTFRECYIVDNYAENGGGIYAYKGGVFENCTIESNEAREDGSNANGLGGGVYVNLGGVFNNCIIHSNTAYSGGGVYLEHSLTDIESVIPQLINCGIGSNQAKNKGAGIFILNGGQVVSSIVANNEVPDVNQAGESGGIHIQEGGEVINCTVVNNHVYEVGSGIAIDDGEDNTPDSGTLSVLNTILWGNTRSFGVSEPFQYHPSTASEYFSYCAIQNYTPGDSDTNIGVDADNAAGPMFYGPTLFTGSASDDTELLEIANSDWGFGLTSPCLDTGDPITSNLPDLDFDGNPRVVKSIVDLGALETLYFTVASSSTGSGTINPDGNTNVLSEGSLNIVLDPADGFGIKVAQDNGSDVLGQLTDNGNGTFTYALSNVIADHVFAAEFVSEYTVAVTVGADGSVDFPGDNSVFNGDDFNLIITPDQGYEVAAFTVDTDDEKGNLVPDGNGSSSYEILNVSADHDIQVTFSFVSAIKAKEREQIRLYPNPAKDKLYMTGVDGNVSLYNNLGQLIKIFSGEELNAGVSVVDLISGVYFVQCSIAGEEKVLKLVIEKW
ncbi:T9SS C-terminal target domain-containing protein [Marinilabiliaceae bacterium JC017]|nr:T9SS C-terminal target domain-containing protein [Marinilabiliaceae bacterium JC017]